MRAEPRPRKAAPRDKERSCPMTLFETLDPAMPETASHSFFQSEEPRILFLCLSWLEVEFPSLTINSTNLQLFFRHKLSFPTSLPLHKLIPPR